MWVFSLTKYLNGLCVINIASHQHVLYILQFVSSSKMLITSPSVVGLAGFSYASLVEVFWTNWQRISKDFDVANMHAQRWSLRHQVSRSVGCFLPHKNIITENYFLRTFNRQPTLIDHRNRNKHTIEILVVVRVDRRSFFTVDETAMVPKICRN